MIWNKEKIIRVYLVIKFMSAAFSTHKSCINCCWQKMIHFLRPEPKFPGAIQDKTLHKR